RSPRALLFPYTTLFRSPGFHQRRHGFRMVRDLAPRRPEVDEHRVAVLADNNIVRRDVAVKEIGLVDQLQRIEHRRDDRVELLLPDRKSTRLNSSHAKSS